MSATASLCMRETRTLSRPPDRFNPLVRLNQPSAMSFYTVWRGIRPSARHGTAQRRGGRRALGAAPAHGRGDGGGGCVDGTAADALGKTDGGGRARQYAMGRQDLPAANIQTALEQISCVPVLRTLRRQLAVSQAHCREAYPVQGGRSLDPRRRDHATLTRSKGY